MSNRRIAAKLLPLLVAAAIAAGCGGAEGRKAKYFDRGKEYLAQENYEKAAVELKNVLQIDPKHAEAYFLLGQVEENRQDHQRAFGFYSKALELKPDYTEAQSRLGRYYLAGGQLKMAAELAESILSRDPKNIDGRLLKAAVYARQGNDQAALKLGHEILTDMPGYPDTVSLISALHFKLKQPGKAVEALLAGIAANPKDTALRLALAQHYSSTEQHEKAVKLLEETVSIEPTKFQPRLRLALYLSRTKHTDQAEKVLRDAINQNPEDAQRRMALADLLGQLRGPTDAEKVLIEGIKALPDSMTLRFALGSVYEQLGAADKARAAYREVLSEQGKKPDGLKARNRIASIALKEGKGDEVEQLINEVLKENPHDNDALILQGKLALTRGKALDAINAFRSVLKDQPNSSQVLVQLADAHFLNKENELARESLQKAVEADPKDPETRLRLAQHYARTHDYRTALKEIDKILAKDPNHLTTLQAQAEIQIVMRDYAGAQRSFERIKTAHPKHPIGFQKLGELFQAQRKHEAALREFEAAHALMPTTVDPISGMAKSYLALGKTEKAIERINEIVKTSPDNVAAHEVLGELYFSKKQYAEAEKELRRAIDLRSFWQTPYVVLAGMYSERGDTPGALRIAEEGLKAIPEDPQLLFFIATTLEHNKEYDKAIATYGRILKRQPDNAASVNNLASLLADHKTDPESLKQARELVARFGDASHPAFLDTAGWVAFKSGETDKALTLLTKVIKVAPEVPVFNYHIGMAYHAKGDMKAARKHLTKATTGKGDFVGIEDAKKTLAGLPAGT